MKTVFVLAKRNMSVFLKDRSSVFFSFLSMFIILGLNILFLGGLNVDNVMDLTGSDKMQATYLTNTWVMAGIIVVNAVTISVTMIGIMVEDEDKKRLQGFLVAPISRMKLILGYITAAFMMSMIFCLITLGCSQLYIVLAGGRLLAPEAFLKLVGIISVNVFSATPFIFLISLFIGSTNAFSALGTIIGTLIGFIAGIYLPMGALPEGVQSVLKFFPVVQGSALMREVYVAEALKETFTGLPQEAVTAYKEYMGICIRIGDYTVEALYQVLILIGSGILFILIALFVLRKRKVTDR